MQNRGFIDSSDDMEKLEPEQNEITVLDESIPSPAEIQTDETIVLPEIISMPEYIRRHYEKDLIRVCINQIYDLTLCVMYEGKLFHDVPGTGPIDYGEEEMVLTDGPTPLEWGEPKPFSFDRNVYSATVRPIDGAITWMDFYRLSDCCVEAELTIEVQLYFRYGTQGAFKKIAQKYYVTAWFEMEDGISAEFGDFRLRRQKRRSDIVKLDDYLVPVFKWDDIEEEAENIILDIVSEGLSDPQRIQPGLFVKCMGLKIVYLPLYKRPRTSSILFFGSGEVLTFADDEDKEEPVSVKVAGNTIVLNTRRVDHERDAIFHECFHYAEHRMFFQLQQLHNTDVSVLSKWKPVSLEKSERSPIEWIEWQAHIGSQCLQMPRKLLRERIADELCDMQTLNRHVGFKLQAAGRKLAKEFNVYNYQLRNRMIHVGYPAARGALNFVEEEYIQPFAFDLGECHGSQTFVITPKEMLEEYLRNEQFREIIDTGRYIYADGHICLNEPQYVVRQGKKLCLTEWANAHVDQCCLRFVRTYHRDRRTHYVFGQLNSDEAYNGRSLALSASERDPHLYEAAIRTSKLLAKLPGAFHEAFAAVMNAVGIKPVVLAEETLMSERTIYRYQEEERSDYSVDTVAVLCVGMHLDPLLSFALMERAGIFLRNTPEDLIIKAVLMGMYQQSVVQVQAYLSEIHYPRVEKWPKLPKVEM